MARKVPADLWDAVLREGRDMHRAQADRLGPKWSGFKSLDPSYESAADPPTCSIECDHCSEQYISKCFTMLDDLQLQLELHSDDRAFSEINELLSQIHGDIDYIKEKIQCYGNVIAKRWLTKYNHKKRENMLLLAKSDLHTRKYAAFDMLDEIFAPPPIVAAKNPGKLLKDFESRYQTTALNPYLDLPSLLEEKFKLLSLIHYRAMSSSSEWLLFDFMQTKGLCHQLQYWSAYNPHCVCLRGQDFGNLVPWSKDAAHKRDIIGYPAARLAFKAQSELMRFLRSMTDLILEGDLSAAIEGCEEWYSLAANNFATHTLDNPISAYFESAFGPPPRFDSGHLVEVFQSRTRAAEDDLRLLQTDPIWFRNFVERSIRSVRVTMKQDSSHQFFVVQLILRSLAKLPMLRWILTKLQRLDELTQQAVADDQQLRDFPEEYWHTLRLVECGLKGAVQSEMPLLGFMTTSSTAFYGQLIFKGRPVGAGEDFWKTDKLLWNITQRERLTELHHPVPMSFHFASIDEILENSTSKDAARIDQVLYDYLSDLAAITEALAAIKYHAHYEQTIAYSKSVDLDFAEDSGEDTGIEQKIATQDSSTNDRIWAKLERFRNLPKPSSKISEQSIADLRHLHNALGIFWQEVYLVKIPVFLRHSVKPEESCDQYITDCSMGLNMEFRLRLEHEWTEWLRAIRAKEMCGKAASTPATIMSLPGTSFSQAKDTNAERPTIAKFKTKTRPVERPASNGVEEAINEIEDLSLAEEPEKRVLVRKDSLAVFERMFARSSAKQAPTKWPQFVAALQDAGLCASRSGGSAVRFSDQRTGQGAVSFHMPHPDSSIPLEWLREMGRRLNGWFGWNEESFVLRSKEYK